MILLRKWIVYTCYAGACLLVAGLGGYAYLVLSRYNALADPATKFRAENIVFFALLGLIILTVAVVLLVRKSTDVLEELDKAGELLRYGPADLAEHLSRWGELGKRIGTLIQRLDRLNAMRALFITSQAGMIGFFLENTAAALVTADSQGLVQQASRRFLERSGLERNAVLGRHLSDLVAELDFRVLAADLFRERNVVHQTDRKVRGGEREWELNLAFYPVFNAAHLLSHVICVIEDENLIVQLADRGLELQQQLQEQVREQGTRLHKRVFGLMQKGIEGLTRREPDK